MSEDAVPQQVLATQRKDIGALSTITDSTSQRKADINLIERYVRTTLWENMRFSTPANMRYGEGSVFLTMVSGMNMPSDISNEKWDEYEKIIRTNLNKKRNNTIAEMHSAFIKAHNTTGFCLDKDTALEDMKCLSEDRSGTYTFLMTTLVPCIMGRTTWKKNAHLKKVSELAGWIDEAFALVVIENYWDKWWATAESVDESSVRVRAKWTDEGKGANASKHSGWHKKGMQEYARMCTLVQKDRDEGGRKREAFEEKLLASYVKEHEALCGKKRKRKCDEIEAYDFEDVMDNLGSLYKKNDQRSAPIVDSDDEPDEIAQI